jgi:hypothetical protein
MKRKKQTKRDEGKTLLDEIVRMMKETVVYLLNGG